MRPTRPKTPKKRLKLEASAQDPIEVYCRIRPVNDGMDNLCANRKDDKTVALFPPEDRSSRVEKEKHFTFKHVFDETTTQKELFDYVGLPLVQDLLQGKNGLLFTYGITSSGKTHTMTGTPHDGGLLPRTLDVIFNSIKGVQAKKYIFKPNNVNGFEIQSNEEAAADQFKEFKQNSEQKDLLKNRRNKKETIGDWCSRIADASSVDVVSQDTHFAVFVTYVEIYNNFVYDLLEDTSKALTTKQIREDAFKNMYVQSATVAEVKTVEEALELFYKGQIKRKVSHTALNTESSRSHSVFTIRVTQAPLDSLGAEVIQDKSQIIISQLSLVDLAGSERQVKSKTVDARLREAGKINTSLMTLRKCIEELRTRQIEGKLDKNVQYRESKLTLLFKTFFEGQGKIRMVVCINPQAHYYEELNQVLIFADKAQDVLVPRSTPVLTPKHMFGFTPGRGQLYKEAIRKAREQGVPVDEVLAPVYSLGPDFPALDRESYDESFYLNFSAFLDARIMRRASLEADLERRWEEFRNNLVATEEELIRLQQKTVSQQMDLEHREQRIRTLEHKASSLQEALDLSEKEKWEIKRQKETKEAEGSHYKKLMGDYLKEIDRVEKKRQEQIAERDRWWKRKMQKWKAEKQADMERKLCHKDELLRMVKEILEKNDPDDPMMFEEFNIDTPVPTTATSSEASVPVTRTRVKSIVESMEPHVETRLSKTRSVTDFTQSSRPNVQFSSQSSQNNVQSLFSKENRPPNSSSGTRNMAIANPRHGRSSSVGDKWIEHKPIGNLELNTVLQPAMKKKKSVSKLEVKDITSNDVSKYVLQHQEQDSQGEVETQLFKADIIPSAGGGAQIIFNDVEKLRQASPPSTYNLRKRSGENLPLREIEDRCTMSVECHGLPSKMQKKK